MSDFAQPEYLWLVVVGSMAAFAFGWGTGSNDVANAFGTSVGAKTLTLKQAVIIAVIFEFVGALVLGRVSTSTIAGGIAQISYFQREPEIYAYGMICALSVGFVWQGLASFWELNVSATHSIIGAIIGFSLVYGGGNAVNWATPDKNSFPPYKGVVPIILSWFVSPVLTGLCSALFFFVVRTAVLRRERSYQLSFWVLPFMVLFTTFINIYFVFTKGAKKTFQSDAKDDWTDGKAAWVAAVIAVILAFLCAVIVLPILKYRADKKFSQDAEKQQEDEEAAKAKAKEDEADRTESGSKFLRAMSSIKKAAMHGMEVDIHQIVEEDPIVAAIHENAEVFDPKAEFAFSYLQVFSAICVIFAHGAGEVGYMAGPLATVWFAVKTGTLPSKVNAPIWCILISALGLVIGLSTYGYNVTRAMGTRMAKLSPTRGFAAELATACIIMIAAQYGLPTSSSQCITGGIVGIGILEGKSGVNWMFLLRQFASWIATLVIVGLSTAALFAQGVFSPSISCNKEVAVYENGVINMASSVVKDVRATLLSYQSLANTSQLPNMPNATFVALNKSASSFISQGSAYLKAGTIKPDDAVAYMAKSLNLLQNYSIMTIGMTAASGSSNLCYNTSSNSSLIPCSAPKPLKAMSPPYNATKFS
ncbi:hypothetical protein VOLCADRAFT_76547 [Volvox carteri f. nagariensis]|uniref:Phosphate transporter n=1 Tax=Volvox carteri f. nagariensis TaxID=3068 RepID=D8U8W6_VOLCA|nr:uncharacterized protein VOLCADRAFT_76547 [Volvox carteri f. nagariensis]EFJ43878.1 hypothetical protein VOLCADRAFT_76547 [Volvox carteri f. nagariensis]|eukprot:XP_002955124.1 hypothetical protein VOLCADRAFT_76547 [Volvox carteri f. nagariensis]